MNNYFKIKIGNCERLLPLVKGDKFSYYSFNMLGDTELNKEAAKEIAAAVRDTEVIVTIESKAIALVQEASSILNHPKYVVIRKFKTCGWKSPCGMEMRKTATRVAVA